jgi:hypothetical protein
LVFAVFCFLSREEKVINGKGGGHSGAGVLRVRSRTLQQRMLLIPSKKKDNVFILRHLCSRERHVEAEGNWTEKVQAHKSHSLRSNATSSIQSGSWETHPVQ